MGQKYWSKQGKDSKKIVTDLFGTHLTTAGQTHVKPGPLLVPKQILPDNQFVQQTTQRPHVAL